MIAGGMAFPDAQDAAAQGSRVQHGYTYRHQICQEWGQQPRWYYVRDPIPGSDWRNDGGWAIVLEGSAAVVDTTVVTFALGTNSLWPGFRYSTNDNFDIENLPAVPRKIVLENSGGAFDDWQGIVALTSGGTVYSTWVYIDVNKDGNIDASDKVRGTGGNAYERLLFTEAGGTAIVGGSYIRWADMRWCR